MRLRLILGWVLVLSLVAAIGYAQQPAPGSSLSLSQALDLARRNNPAYQQVLNNRRPASRDLLSATTSLFTPSVDVNGSYYWSPGGGSVFLGGALIPIQNVTATGYGLGLNYSLSGTTISRRGLAAAELRATDEDITNALTVLETSVRTQYLLTLEAQAQVAVAIRTLERAKEQFNLAQARYTVGQGTLIDLRRAEVDTGTAAVGLLRAEQTAENQLLLLFDEMGVRAPSTLRMALPDSFPVLPPPWNMDSLITFALDENPALRSLRAREASARWSVRAARSEYLPSLNVSASTGERTTHVSAGGSSTSTLTRSPWQVNVGLSLPIYDGFQRYSRTASAQASEDDLRQQVRARELQVRSDIVAAFHSLDAAYRAVSIQDANKRAAAEAFELATQRYRVGSGSFLEQLDARLAADRADADYITAVYAYHRSIAALERAVGHTLR